MNIDLLDIQKETNSIFDAEHKCPENQFPGEFKILHCVSVEEIPQNTWQFHKFWLARPKDVEMGEASEVGEVVSHGMFVLKFCPFCGTKLEVGHA